MWVAWEHGRPGDSISINSGVELPHRKAPGPSTGVGSKGETKTGARDGTTKRSHHEARWEGSAGVGASHSTGEAGEPAPRGPGGGKGAPCRGAAGGKQPGDIEPRSAVHVTPPDSVSAGETTARRAGCVNCARPDLRERWGAIPIATRLVPDRLVGYLVNTSTGELLVGDMVVFGATQWGCLFSDVPDGPYVFVVLDQAKPTQQASLTGLKAKRGSFAVNYTYPGNRAHLGCYLFIAWGTSTNPPLDSPATVTNNAGSTPLTFNTAGQPDSNNFWWLNISIPGNYPSTQGGNDVLYTLTISEQGVPYAVDFYITS